MAGRARKRALQQARLEGRIRYGPEKRGLRELALENQDELQLELAQARGTAAGITSMVDAARPTTRRIYDRAQESLDAVESDVGKLGLSGLVADITAREQGGAERRLAETRAGDLADLQDRKVRAAEGRAYAVNNAIGQYKAEDAKIDRQQQALRGEQAQFVVGAFEGLMDDARALNLEKRRLRLSERAEQRQMRATEAEITGVDPLTGLPTAIARDRAEDNARADAKNNKPKGPSRGEISDHQQIIGSIQDAKAQAQRLRKSGLGWGEIANALTLPKGEKTPYGGYGPRVSQAAVELARNGKLSPSTLRSLKARGFLPRRAPGTWRRNPPRESVRRAGDRAVSVLGNLGLGS